MTRPLRRHLGTVALVAVAIGAVAGGVVISRRVLPPEARRTERVAGPTAAETSAPADPPDALRTFEVAAATGDVFVERGTTWQPIRPGDTLARTDVVRTAAGGGATLRLSAGTEIELRPGVEVALDQLAGVATVDLRRGKLLARVTSANTLAITSHETKTANSGPARFVVLADDHGRVSVAALEGTASFSAGGKTVSVPAGRASSSRAGAPPDDPESISEDVLLSVVWPAVEARGERAEIKGRAAPAAIVTVRTPDASATATVGEDGAFALAVPIREAKTPVKVEAESLLGQTRTASTTLSRRSREAAPILRPEAADLWNRGHNDTAGERPRP